MAPDSQISQFKLKESERKKQKQTNKRKNNNNKKTAEIFVAMVDVAVMCAYLTWFNRRNSRRITNMINASRNNSQRLAPKSRFDQDPAVSVSGYVHVRIRWLTHIKRTMFNLILFLKNHFGAIALDLISLIEVIKTDSIDPVSALMRAGGLNFRPQ